MAWQLSPIYTTGARLLWGSFCMTALACSCCFAVAAQMVGQGSANALPLSSASATTSCAHPHVSGSCAQLLLQLHALPACCRAASVPMRSRHMQCKHGCSWDSANHNFQRWLHSSGAVDHRAGLSSCSIMHTSIVCTLILVGVCALARCGAAVLA